MRTVNLLDCTLRDGGYYNDWKFNDTKVEEYLKKVYLAKVDVVEIGFRFLNSNKNLGKLAITNEKILKNIPTSKSSKLAIMLNTSDLLKIKVNDKKLLDNYFVDKKKSKISIIRLATHFGDIFKISGYVKYLNKLGYRVFVNLMQINRISENELIKALKELKRIKDVEVFYFADSFGNMKPEDIKKICKIIKKNWPKNFGIHTHDNCGYALENSLTALKYGAKWVDSTIQGMGRGAGNVSTEDLVCELSKAGFKKYDPYPIYSLSQSYFLELKKKYKWGKSIYYHLAAINNIHPTYIQELLVDERYAHDEILNIISSLSQINTSSFNSTTLNEIVNVKVDFEKAWDAKNWCQNKNVMLIGQGKNIKKYETKIYKYIKQKNCKVICLNINKNFKSNFIDYYIASNEARIMVDFKEYCNLKKKIILPLDRVKKIIGKINTKNIKNYGFILSKNKLNVYNKYCELPNSLVIGYAMALCFIGKAKNVYLAGFDGYKDNNPLNREMNQYFNKIKTSFPNLNFTSITPTNYLIKKKIID